MEQEEAIVNTNKLWSLAALAVLATWISIAPAAQAQRGFPLENCRGGAFSTEEDFRMTRGEPFDGNPIISDGDLLSPSGQVCARNRALLAAFLPKGAVPQDLGLDAVDVLDIERRLVAFSTELDDPFGSFTAGDLLFTNGGMIPNLALVQAFDLRHDLGLDAVELRGRPEAVAAIAAMAAELPPDEWSRQGRLVEELKKYGVELWFSTEGTAPLPEAPAFLDGDLLSAFGFIVVPNSALLPPPVPAGLPDRGVDFGLDAVTALPRTEEERLLYSTEILFRGDEFSFDDGDVLASGNGIATAHGLLIAAFHPAADFLGLDALWGSGPGLDRPELQEMCGETAWDFDGGVVAVDAAGTGLFYTGYSIGSPQDPRRPCGWYVPFHGFLPDGIAEFRVAYRAAGVADPGAGVADGVFTKWRIKTRDGLACNYSAGVTLESDNDGWFDAFLWKGYFDGSLTGNCQNNDLKLAVWDTNNERGWTNPPPDKDGHYIVWLEWRLVPAGPAVREPVDHHVQLDNTRPEINDLRLTYMDGVTEVDVNACGETEGVSEFKVYGDFYDKYFYGYRVRVRGGSPPGSVHYPSPAATWHKYWDATPEVANIDSTGTTPLATTVFLLEIDMYDFGKKFTDCCYVLDLWARDAAIRHNFNLRLAWPQQPGWAWPNSFLTFAAGPP